MDELRVSAEDIVHYAYAFLPKSEIDALLQRLGTLLSEPHAPQENSDLDAARSEENVPANATL